MPTFLRFPNGGDTLLNVRHLVSVQCQERAVEEKDLPRVGHLFQLGQTMYILRLKMKGCSSMDIENTQEAGRDALYQEVIAVLQPIVIGGTPAPPVAKPPRKPRAKKGEE